MAKVWVYVVAGLGHLQRTNVDSVWAGTPRGRKAARKRAIRIGGSVSRRVKRHG